MTFTIFPAVDIQSGRAVQLVQGISESEKVFGGPVEAALRWKEEGAEWLHVVDLDAAFGRGSNVDAIARIVEISGMHVELTGGIRDDYTLARALDTGCSRVNIGTAVISQPTWVDEVIGAYGERVAIALDVRGEALATHGWVNAAGSLWSTLDHLNQIGCRRVVVTDTTADGTLSGLNISLLTRVATQTSAAVIASGGVGSLNDLRALKALEPQGVEGVIIGTALYEGRFSLSEAIRLTGSV